MKFTNIEVNEETGTLKFDVKISTQESAFLINHAVNNLIATGAITLSGIQEEEEIELRSVAH